MRIFFIIVSLISAWFMSYMAKEFNRLRKDGVRVSQGALDAVNSALADPTYKDEFEWLETQKLFWTERLEYWSNTAKVGDYIFLSMIFIILVGCIVAAIVI